MVRVLQPSLFTRTHAISSRKRLATAHTWPVSKTDVVHLHIHVYVPTHIILNVAQLIQILSYKSSTATLYIYPGSLLPLTDVCIHVDFTTSQRYTYMYLFLQSFSMSENTFST